MSISIRNALIAIIGVLLLCIAGQGLFALYNTAGIHRNVEREAHIWLKSVNALEEVAFDLIQLRVRHARHLLTTVDTEKAAIDKQIADVLKKLDNDRAAYEKLIQGDDERAIYNGGMKEMPAYMSLHEKLIKASNAGDHEAGRAVLNGDLKKVSDKVLEGVRNTLALVREKADRDYENSASQYSAVLIFTWFGIVASIVVGLGAMWYAVFGISERLRELTRSMTAIAGGALSTDVPYSQSSNELGEMARVDPVPR
jgi:methyl-accepting chemotaxis protein